MADSDPKDLTAILTSRGQTPVIAMVLILATTMGVLNLSPRPGANSPAQDAAAKRRRAPARPQPQPLPAHRPRPAPPMRSMRSSRSSDSST